MRDGRDLVSDVRPVADPVAGRQVGHPDPGGRGARGPAGARVARERRRQRDAGELVRNESP